MRSLSKKEIAVQTNPNPASADVCTAFPAAKAQRAPRAKRLQSLRTELLQKAENLGLVPPGASLLPACPKLTKHDYSYSSAYFSIESSDELGNEIRLQTAHKPDKSFERHGVWYGSETRVDSTGKKWRRGLDHDYVVDNFGDLVPVPA